MRHCKARQLRTTANERTRTQRQGQRQLQPSTEGAAAVRRRGESGPAGPCITLAQSAARQLPAGWLARAELRHLPAQAHPSSGPGEAVGLVGEGAAAALHNHARRVAARAHALGHVLAAHLRGGGRECGVQMGFRWGPDGVQMGSRWVR